MRDVIIGGAVLFVVCTITAFVGAHIGTSSAERRIAQDCAADGRFTVERKGISWVYTCSKPKLGLIQPWEE